MLAKFEFNTVSEAEEAYIMVFEEVGYRGGTSRKDDCIEVHESCLDPRKVKDICVSKGGRCK